MFKYGKRMKPGSFRTMIKFMTEHTSGVLKRGGPEASKAMKNAKRPTYKDLTEPVNGLRKEMIKFEFAYNLHLKQEANWSKKLGCIFKKLSSHCSPNTKTKLHGTTGCDAIEDD